MHLEKTAAVDVILRDGSTLRLRAPARSDTGALVAFFERPIAAALGVASWTL